MKKIIATILFLCLFINLSISQDNLLKYGISLGINMQSPIISQTNWKNQGLDELKSLNIIPGFGFQLGVSASYLLSDNFKIRTNPSIDFTKTQLEFIEVLDKITNHTIENVGIQIPIRLEWKGTSWKYKPTISMGGSYFRSFIITELKTPFALKLDDIAAQIALGINIDMGVFNMMPQLIYSNGLNNLEQLDYNIYTRAIQSWNNQMLTMQVIFEGK